MTDMIEKFSAFRRVFIVSTRNYTAPPPPNRQTFCFGFLSSFSLKIYLSCLRFTLRFTLHDHLCLLSSHATAFINSPSTKMEPTSSSLYQLKKLHIETFYFTLIRPIPPESLARSVASHPAQIFLTPTLIWIFRKMLGSC